MGSEVSVEDSGYTTSEGNEGNEGKGAAEMAEAASREPKEETSPSEAPAMDPTKWHPNVIVSQSRAYASLFTKLRDVNTSSEDFVKYAKRAMRILAEDALAEFAGPDKLEIRTPCGPFVGIEPVDPSDLCLVSIVRSGDALLEAVRECLPGASVGKILIQRDETHPKKLPKLFYSKLPPVKKKHYLLCDPMLATGGSAMMALDVMKVKHKIPVSSIVFCNVICAPEGLRALGEAFPKVRIVTACIDSHLNEDKFIVPGLGDYGDRFFNTEG